MPTKIPSISISLLNSDSTIASIEGNDGMDAVRLCKVPGQGPEAQRKCCHQAIKELERLSVKFSLLAGEPVPARSYAQERINAPEHDRQLTELRDIASPKPKKK